MLVLINGPGCDVKLAQNDVTTDLSENAPGIWGVGRVCLGDGLVDLEGKVLELMEGIVGWGKGLWCTVGGKEK